MKLSAALSRFLIACTAAYLSPRTTEWYRQFLWRLVEYLHDPDLQQVTTDDLNRFVADLRGKKVRWEKHPRSKPTAGGLSAATLSGYVRAIKRLFNWLEENGDITTAQNIALRLKKPKLAKSALKGISISDIRVLLDVASKKGNMGKRDYAIILFLIDTGCRVGGLVNLKVSELDFDNGRALVTEKGNKSRFVFIQQETASAIKAWLAECSPATEYVFTIPGGTMKISTVYHMLRRLKLQAGIQGRVNPHSFRHAYAKMYLTDGGDLASLSDMLGHSDVTVTKNFYGVFTQAELKRKHKKHSGLHKIMKKKRI